METVDAEMKWYCLSTRPRQENKVALLLQKEAGLEVFSPRIRFRRLRSGQPIWVLEALFPGYVFGRFIFPDSHRQIRAVSGISGIVSFGSLPTALPDTLIADLRSRVDDRETLEINTDPVPGSEIIVASGPLAGVQALVTRVLPARQRVAILLELLGQTREVVIETERVMLKDPRRTK